MKWIRKEYAPDVTRQKMDVDHLLDPAPPVVLLTLVTCMSVLGVF